MEIFKEAPSVCDRIITINKKLRLREKCTKLSTEVKIRIKER